MSSPLFLTVFKSPLPSAYFHYNRKKQIIVLNTDGIIDKQLVPDRDSAAYFVRSSPFYCLQTWLILNFYLVHTLPPTLNILIELRLGIVTTAD